MQRSFDDLGTPLDRVTFVVFDVETTGTAARDGDQITEIGAVKVRGGECLGTFSTLVNPGCAIPAAITVLTGITQSMVMRAPRMSEVLPSFLEFTGGAVLVGHNVRFDLAFLGAACEANGWARPTNPSVDTNALARRLVRDEVPNCRLATLADRFRLDHRPTHRALDDALATTDLLHLLLERAASWGVLGLDDLLALPKMDGHPQAAKLRLTTSLPRSPGVYLFRDGDGRVLYVGKATNLRQRVRSYFSGDERRKVAQLLREARAIDHVVCASTLEAAVLEVRLIHRHQPRFNRQAKLFARYHYLKLTLGERWPRLAVVRSARADGALYLGPLPSAAAARLVADAVESVVPLRRCTGDPRRARREAPCAPAQIGVSLCPCAGGVDEARYRAEVARAVQGLTSDPDVLLAPLAARMVSLAAAERFEEAADVRDRAEALAAALARQRRVDGLRRAGRVRLRTRDGAGAELAGGRLVRSWRTTEAHGADAGGDGARAEQLGLDVDGVPGDERTSDERTVAAGSLAGDATGPVAKDVCDELSCVAAWLEAEAAAGRVRLEHCDGELASALPRIPRFAPREARVPGG